MAFEGLLSAWLTRVLDARLGDRVALVPAERLSHCQLDRAIIAADGQLLAAVELEARVDKQARGALWDLISHPAPLAVMVWASQGYGTRGGFERLPLWVEGLRSRVCGDSALTTGRFVALIDSMDADHPEVDRLVLLLEALLQAGQPA